MIGRDEVVAAPWSAQRLPSLRIRLAALRGEVQVGSVDLVRIGLVVASIGLQTLALVSPGHFRPAGNAFFAVLVPVATLGSLSACLAIALPIQQLMSVRVRQAIGAAALVLVVFLSVIGFSRGIGGVWAMVHGSPYSNDGAVFDLYGADQLRHGRNPYFQTNIVTALAAIDAPATTVTPLMNGQFRGARAYPSEAAIQQAFLNVLHFRPRTIPPEFESKYNYPAGSFLFILPFAWAGIHDMRFLYALAIVLMGAFIWTRLPRALRPLVPLILLADVPVVVLAAGGQPDPLYGIFLMVGVAEWTTPWLSPSMMGIAIGTKQLAWFVAPFYVLLVAREFGWREAARRLGIMSLIFVVLNGPFILWSPTAYLQSVFGPITDPMFPLGVGAIALFVANVLPMIPKLVFTVAELASWAGSTLAFARYRWLTPAGAVVLAALPLFFAWRSLVNYFYLVPLLVLAVTFSRANSVASSAPRPRIN